MSRIALLCYHKNALKIYNPEWVEQYKHSVENQTHSDFSIMEMNYGGSDYRIFENSYFESAIMATFVHALNYLLDKCFSSGYDYVLNSNVDDYFSLDRIKKQLPYLKDGYDIVSSNFALIENSQLIKIQNFDELSIEQELEKDHNIVAHPIVAYSKRFWENNRYVSKEIPYEDLLIWKRAIASGSRFIILKECLLFHRLHNQSICQSDNK